MPESPARAEPRSAREGKSGGLTPPPLVPRSRAETSATAPPSDVGRAPEKFAQTTRSQSEQRTTINVAINANTQYSYSCRNFASDMHFNNNMHFNFTINAENTRLGSTMWPGYNLVQLNHVAIAVATQQSCHARPRTSKNARNARPRSSIALARCLTAFGLPK